MKMFDKAKQHLLPHIEDQLKQVEKVKTIIMVGGFSESEVMKSAVQERFQSKGLDIVFPEGASLAIVKGIYFNICDFYLYSISKA